MAKTFKLTPVRTDEYDRVDIDLCCHVAGRAFWGEAIDDSFHEKLTHGETVFVSIEEVAT